AGIPALIDLRGAPDHTGRELEATIVALADEIAAASGLVMRKAAHVPAALIRGVATGGARAGSGADLVRRPQDDLFRESPLQALHARRTIRSTLFCQEETRAVLGMDDRWFALGTVACGRMPEGEASRPRPPIDLSAVARFDEPN